MKIFQACWLPAQFVATLFTGVSALAENWPAWRGPAAKSDNWSSMVLADGGPYAINQDGDAFVRTPRALRCFRESRK